MGYYKAIINGNYTVIEQGGVYSGEPSRPVANLGDRQGDAITLMDALNKCHVKDAVMRLLLRRYSPDTPMRLVLDWKGEIWGVEPIKGKDDDNTAG